MDLLLLLVDLANNIASVALLSTLRLVWMFPVYPDIRGSGFILFSQWLSLKYWNFGQLPDIHNLRQMFETQSPHSEKFWKWMICGWRFVDFVTMNWSQSCFIADFLLKFSTSNEFILLSIQIYSFFREPIWTLKIELYFEKLPRQNAYTYV